MRNGVMCEPKNMKNIEIHSAHTTDLHQTMPLPRAMTLSRCPATPFDKLMDKQINRIGVTFSRKM